MAAATTSSAAARKRTSRMKFSLEPRCIAEVLSRLFRTPSTKVITRRTTRQSTLRRLAGLVLAAQARARGPPLGVTPVQWTVNCFRDRHRAVSEGGTEIAPRVSIVDPEGTVRSRDSRDRSYIMGER